MGRAKNTVQDTPLYRVHEAERVRPFVKWAGGKGQLLTELQKLVGRLPNRFQTYFEPFVGGGALFFALQPTHSVLCDTNPDLLNAYRVVQSQLQPLLADLRRHEHTEEYYYALRNEDRNASFASWSDVERASRFIYLNRTCFNGLYRVNSRGEFNVPFGDYTNPTIVDEAALAAASEALKDSSLRLGEYHSIEGEVERGDFVYFDPPYVPISKTSSFTAYTRSGFSMEDHVRLRDLCVRLTARGAFVAISNSSHPLIEDLYQGFRVDRVSAARAINSKAERRGALEELLISNF